MTIVDETSVQVFARNLYTLHTKLHNVTINKNANAEGIETDQETIQELLTWTSGVLQAVV